MLCFTPKIKSVQILCGSLKKKRYFQIEGIPTVIAKKMFSIQFTVQINFYFVTWEVLKWVYQIRVVSLKVIPTVDSYV